MHFDSLSNRVADAIDRVLYFDSLRFDFGLKLSQLPHRLVSFLFRPAPFGLEPRITAGDKKGRPQAYENQQQIERR
jgi:hypothetical protein